MKRNIEITESAATGKQKVGRPRALNREQIVTAALRLGLESLTMKGVAAELGVTIATLYTYVDDRDHLFRLAVDQAMTITRLPPDRGQHWSDYISEFAGAICAKLTSDRLILDHLIDRGIGLETELRLSEVFLEAMASRGFASAEAARILDLVGVAAFGASVRAHCSAARIARHGSLKRAVEETLIPFGPGEMQHVRALSQADAASEQPLIERMIEPLIAQIAMARNETLPSVRG